MMRAAIAGLGLLLCATGGVLAQAGAGQLPFRDPFYIMPYGTALPNSGFAFVNTSGYTQASCTPVAGTNKNIVIFGQSLAANNSSGTYTVTNPTKVLNFNIFDGKCYQAQYVLLGTTQFGGTSDGSYLTMMGDNLINNDGVAQVVLIPAAVNSTLIAQWASSQTAPYLLDNIATVARRLNAANIIPTEIIWEQGESDCGASTSQSSYSASLAVVIAAIRSVWPSTPIIINSAETYVGGVTCSSVAAAQAAAVNPAAGIFAGANLDSLGSGDRQVDNTHFTVTGAALAAALQEATIVAH